MKIITAVFALTLLLMTGLTFVPEVKAVNLISYSDDFEDDVLTQPPEGDFYLVASTSGGTGGNCGASGTQVDTTDTVANSGSQAVTFTSGSSSGNGSPACIIFNDNNCNINGWTMNANIYLTNYPTGTSATYSLQPSAIQTGSTPRVSINSVGDVSIGTGTLVAGGTLSLNTWHSITFGPLQCESSPTQTRYATVCFDATCTEQALPSGLTNLRYFKFIHGSSGTGSTGYLDDLSLGSTFVTWENENSLSGLTNVVGFDVDKAGAVAVIRHLDGSDQVVSVLDAQSLSSYGNLVTNCNRVEGVMAFQDGVGYIECDGSAVVTGLTFVDETGSAFGLNQDTISLAPFTLENDWINLVAAQNAFGSTSSGGQTVFDFAFLVGRTDGQVGAVTIVQDTLGNTIFDEAYISFGSVNPDDICGDYDFSFYAVEDAHTTRGYDTTSISGIGTADAGISNSFTGGAAINSAFDVDCGATRIVIGKGANLHVINRADGATLWNRAYSTLTAVTISHDSKWVAAVADDGTINSLGYIYNATDGTHLGMFEVPSGTISEMEMDEFGQSVWIQTTTGVFRSTIYEATTVVPVNTIPEPGSTSTSTSTGGGGFVGGSGDGSDCTGTFLGINISYIAGAWSTTDTAIRWLLGLLLLSLIVWGFSKTGSAFLIIIAIILGTGIGIVFCLFPVWLLLVEIFVLVLAVGKMIFSGNNGE